MNRHTRNCHTRQKPQKNQVSKYPRKSKQSQSPEVEKSFELSEIEESPKSPDDESLDVQESCIEIPIQSELQPSVYELVLKELQEASTSQPRHKQLKGTASNISLFYH